MGTTVWLIMLMPAEAGEERDYGQVVRAFPAL